MRVIEAQCSWCWRLTITPHINQNWDDARAQIDLIGVPWLMIGEELSAAPIGGSGAPLGLGLQVNVVTPAGELIVDGRRGVIVSGLRSCAWCFATSSRLPLHVTGDA